MNGDGYADVIVGAVAHGRSCSGSASGIADGDLAAAAQLEADSAAGELDACSAPAWRQPEMWTATATRT